MPKIVIASSNKGKLKEYESLLKPLGFEIFSLFDFPDLNIIESGTTFSENALLKAKALKKRTNELVLADDSGLEVTALNNRPGVYSKRFSKEGTDHANNLKLLDVMEKEADRSARFITVIVLLDKDHREHYFKGILEGYIHTKTEGNNGFGYDPLFIPAGYHQTLAELDITVKNKISHRAKALRKVLDYLQSIT